MRPFSLLLSLKILFVTTSALAGIPSWNQTLWDPAQGIQVSPTVLDELAAEPAIFVLGEEHYNPPVQEAEAWLLDRIARQVPSKDDFILGWEFLNTVDRFAIDEHWTRYQKGALTTTEFLQQLFPAGPASIEYAPVLETARTYHVTLIPTNLTRTQKSPVTREGIEALDPALLPPDFALGGPLYLERFQAAMGSHPLPYPIENYFAAQSLTDEVMATELLKIPSRASRLLITGSFHGDYRDGVIRSLERRVQGLPILYIRIVDASGMTVQALQEFMVHPRYGAVADLVYIVNEPQP
ncbi:ChaN family lipoprotein [Oligoflexus tunisiensis]|uniref:ChaN family lipoprotein n=1 Tax=Oligoflexus tunisiensis TaxID=708132 RepID=UPI00114CFBD6|nr:ChaN family lipoprotein [Oligoflexus tunisiensis]